MEVGPGLAHNPGMVIELGGAMCPCGAGSENERRRARRLARVEEAVHRGDYQVSAREVAVAALRMAQALWKAVTLERRAATVREGLA